MATTSTPNEQVQTGTGGTKRGLEQGSSTMMDEGEKHAKISPDQQPSNGKQQAAEAQQKLEEQAQIQALSGIGTATVMGSSWPEEKKYCTSDVFIRGLCSTRAESFAIEGAPESTPIFVAERQDKIVDVFRGMVEKNILSVPVLLKEEKRYFGFIDMADIVRYIVNHFGPRAHKDQDFWELVKEEKKFQDKTVADVMAHPVRWRNPFVPVTRGYSAMAVLEPLAREPNLLRVPIIDRETRQMYNLVTSTQAVRYVGQRLEILGTIKAKPLGSFTTAPVLKPVISVSENSPAIEAFQKMVDENVFGVAVLDEEGRLTGALSLRDIKLISHDARFFWRLNQTVKNFVQKLRHEFQERHQRPPRVVYAYPESSLESVIKDMTEERVHRVYLVNNKHDKKPVGVVSIKDVLLEILTTE